METLRIGDKALFSVTKGPHPREIRKLNTDTTTYEDAKQNLNMGRGKEEHIAVERQHQKLMGLYGTEVRSHVRVAIFDRPLLNIPLPMKASPNSELRRA